MNEELIFKCYIKIHEEDGQEWLHFEYNPRHQPSGSSSLIKFYSKQQLLEEAINNLTHEFNLFFEEK